MSISSSGRLPSVNSSATHTFSRAPQASIPRSKFNRSHGVKTTFDEGYLVPVFVDEALPGDTFNLNMTAFARVATPIFPIMDNLYMESFFFAVPYRLVWDNWEKFNGAQTNPGDSTDFVIPQLELGVAEHFEVNTLGDYMGLPINVNALSVSALWFRAYNLIWNQWFRSEDLQDSVTVDTDNGPDALSQYSVLRRGKRYDYFTSCLPFPQKGPSVELPLGTSAPVIGNAADIFAHTAAVATDFNLNVTNASGVLVLDTSPGAISALRWTTDPTKSGLIADLTDATAATINALRQAFQTQKLYERDARGGTRYTEIIRSHFGVTSDDARLQRAEYLGGGSTPVIISPVTQTSESNSTPQGNLAAFGTCAMSGHGFTKSFTEHCLIIGMVATRADLNYQQCTNRMWSRSTRFDFYWPALSHIGEQAVLTKEIFTTGTSTDEDVFGYQERFAEYRYKPSQITGLFRSGIGGTLDAWHLAQDFSGGTPVLNDEFIVEEAPMDRVIAVASQPHFIFDSWFRLECARPMPVYSVPGLVDHF